MGRPPHPTLERRKAGHARVCDADGCHAPGDFRAPRSRAHLDEFLWFCLEHVREYNRSWNYCAGMSVREIESEIRNDTVWRRPTWPLGSKRAQTDYAFEAGYFGDGFGLGDDIRRDADGNGAAANSAERRALETMELAPPLDLTHLKARYKELVKRYHPDANGGDNAAEERLKDINEAYTTLKRFLLAQ